MNFAQLQSPSSGRETEGNIIDIFLSDLLLGGVCVLRHTRVLCSVREQRLRDLPDLQTQRVGPAIGLRIERPRPGGHQLRLGHNLKLPG